MHFNSLSPYALFAFEYVRVNCTCRIYLACCRHVVKRNFRTQSVLLLPKILSRVWNVPYNPRPPIAGTVQYQPPPPPPRPTILSPDVNTKPHVNNYNKTKNRNTNDDNDNNNNDNNNNLAEDEANTTYARRTKAKAKHQGRQQLRSKWASKALLGKYPQRVKQADVDQDKTHGWLKAAGLKAETEGFIIAAQDKSLATTW